ncbi:MAG: 5'/3'-nucleotidase SurE, partial [Crocinitomicaceae bacterium]
MKSISDCSYYDDKAKHSAAFIYVNLAQMEQQKLILITNDDSVHAKGLHTLVSVAKKIGQVVVVAPDKPQSGMGHAITIHHPLRLKQSFLFGKVEAYSCSGTPVDCVKLGIYEVLKKRPDLILSGINHGENSSTNVLYSG